MDSNYSRNLLVGFGLSLLILTLSTVASLISIEIYNENIRDVERSNKIIRQLENAESWLKDAETWQRGYLLSGDSVFLHDFRIAQKRANALLTSVEHLTEIPYQSANCIKLEKQIEDQFNYLEAMISRKATKQIVSLNDLKRGKTFMDANRVLIDEMIAIENAQLTKYSNKTQSSSTFTPIFIIVAFILSAIIAIVFYIILRKDFRKRKELVVELALKDEETERRIDLIKDISNRISDGDYSMRLSDRDKDSLGQLALAINKMTSSLESSFQSISDNEWLQKSIATHNDAIVGEKNLSSVTDASLEVIIKCSESQVGALYVVEGEKLELCSGYGYDLQHTKTIIDMGEGLVGQCAKSGEGQILNHNIEEHLVISYATGEIKANNLAVYPVHHNGKLKGVIQIASLEPYTALDQEFISAVCPSIGVAINSARSHKKLQELLEENQVQTEELQSQHSELESLNSELEAYTQKLQASEEELKVQQEELMQINQELEERSALLEDRNHVIIQRNREIQEKAEELAISTKYKSEFLANMSHELRTPLNSILLLSRLLAENNNDNLSDEQIEYASVIQNSGKSLLSLIDEILDLSKIESGKMTLEYTEVTVNEIVQDMKDLFVPVARDKKIDFIINIAEDMPNKLQTDKMRLEQIIKNLISNALKFTAEGSVTLDIAPAAPDMIRFTVTDTGIGIPEDKQKLIFEAFQQADGSTRRKFGGTGLGLSISRELSKLLQGNIDLQSEAGKGSSFMVTIPITFDSSQTKIEVDRTLDDKVEVLREEINKELPIEEPAPFTSAVIPEPIADDRKKVAKTDKSILIVEDDTEFAKLLTEVSRKNGFKVISTVRGDQAMSLAVKYQPQAILLDIVLPMKNGWQIMEELKNNPSTRHIPVHMMSSMEAKRESISKGAVDFINKPFALDKMPDIFSKLEKAINQEKKKVIIVEENSKHAEALAGFLQVFNISVHVSDNLESGSKYIEQDGIDCLILDIGEPGKNTYKTLQTIKDTPALNDLPVVIFTGKSLSKTEEMKIKQYADSIIVKTAHSYQRILDEVALFLHLITEEQNRQALGADGSLRLSSFKEILQGKKVLIADDDVRNIYSLSKALEAYEMETLSAVDGKDALKVLDNNPDIKIVLMDMMMPELDGYDAIAEIRKDPRFKNLPILAVTAKAMSGDRDKCIQAGASDYISKPVDIDQLVSLLRVWLY